MTQEAHTLDAAVAPSFAEATRIWARIGLLSFGGPAGQIALMHKELVERRRWISEPRFLHALSYCMLLPGPEAQQLAIYIGWLMHGLRGGLVAGWLFVAPGFAAILTLSVLYASFRELPLVAAVMFGLKATVLAIVLEALLRIARRALKTRFLIVVALVAFVLLAFLKVPFPLVVIGAGLAGVVGARWLPQAAGHSASTTKEEHFDDAPFIIDALIERGELVHTRPAPRRALALAVVGFMIWLAPLALLVSMLGSRHVLVAEATLFSKAAVVTFGGAYAVLSYVAQRAVEAHHWLSPGEMLDGLGLAETTPGPLIIVLQFVGFMAAYHAPEPWSPILAGVLGSVVTVWVTFVPCFIWVFVGAPWVEALRKNRALGGALTTVTAAIVGVILNLTLWFFLHTAFGRVDEVRWGLVTLTVPAVSTVSIPTLLVAIGSAVALLRFKLGLGKVLVGGALAGAVLRMVLP